MSWIEISTHTTREAIDWIRTLLAAIDYTQRVNVISFDDSLKHGLEIEQEANWEFTVRIYLPNDGYMRMQLEKISDSLLPLQRTGMISRLQIAEINRNYLVAKSVDSIICRIGKFTIAQPDSNIQSDSTNEILLKLASSLAFGSGLHPATALSLQLLQRYVLPGMNVLDLGCGSGILSVAMAKLGAQVLAIDNDSIAVEATQAAIALNELNDCITVQQASLGEGSHLGHWLGNNLQNEIPTVQPVSQFDLIVANLLARIHIALAGDYGRALRRTPHAGLLITAGFTTDYEEEINTAFTEAGFEQVDHHQVNEWISFVHRL